MAKKLFITALITIICGVSMAQHTLEFTQPDLLFHQGKELFNQRKYAASYRNFEEFLKNTAPTDAGMIVEAEYYLCSNIYELRQQDAKLRLKEYLEKHPYTPYMDRMHFMLGMLEYEAKNYLQALNSFRMVDETHLIDSERTDLLYCRGYANLATDNTQKALDIFNTLKTLDTRYQATAKYYAGYCQYQLGNYAAALPDLLAVENHPEFEDVAPYYITQIYYANKEYNEVEKRAEKLLKKFPNNKNNAEIYRILGEKAYADGNYPKALDNLKKYEKTAAQVLRADMYYLGVSCLKTDKAQEAVKYLSKVTTGDDEMSESAYLQLGNAYIKLGDIPNAKMAYETATRTRFNVAVREEALFNYALTTYETSSAFGESIKAFEQFITEFPTSPKVDQAYDYLSTVYLTSKDYQSAYRSVSKIKNLTPKLRETKQYLEYQLGTEAFTASNYVKAADYFSKALQSAPQGKYLTDIYYWRAESYYRTGEFAKSASDLQTFFNQSDAPKNNNYTQGYYGMGYANFKQKKYSEALNWFLKYIREENNTAAPAYADALNRIGDGYFNARNFTKATEYYDKATEVSPYNGDYAIFQSAYTDGLQKNYSKKINKLEQLLVKYPRSEYGDDALYEIARAWLMLENNVKTIETFDRLTETYPNSSLAPKAQLESGLVYFNQKNYNKAIPELKKVVSDYPGSEEADVALESLETIYVEKNEVDDYLNYTRSLGRNSGDNNSAREDSISFVAAEKQYMNAGFEGAVRSLSSYLNKYCPGGKFCSLALYYLADSYYRTKDKENALTTYNKLLNMPGNPYMEEASLRSAEIAFDKKDYSSALVYFKKLQTVAQTTENSNIARLGILRCSYFLNNHTETEKIATEILSDPKTPEAVKSEAKLNRAKARAQQNKLTDALKDLKEITIDTRTSIGAEAKFTLADVLFKLNRLNEAETEVLDFAKKGTPYQYWLASSFIVLADVYIQKGDDFQAKQYLLSLQKNYTVDDDIQPKIITRLTAIENRTKTKVIK